MEGLLVWVKHISAAFSFPFEKTESELWRISSRSSSSSSSGGRRNNKQQLGLIGFPATARTVIEI